MPGTSAVEQTVAERDAMMDARTKFDATAGSGNNRDDPAQQIALLEQLYRTAPVGLAFLDTELHLVRVNERFAEIVGRSLEGHIGRPLREVIPDIAEYLEPLCHKVIRNGQPIIDVEVSGTTPADPFTQSYWRTSCHPVTGDDGDAFYV